MLRKSKANAPSGRTRAIIFDFDGTIADSIRAFAEVFAELTNRPEHLTDAEIDEFRAMSIPEFIRAVGVPAWKVPILLVKGRKMLREHMHGISVHEGMADAIKALHKHGVPLYVLSSNSTENVQKYLQWHKLSPYFRNVYGGVNIFAKAPKLLKLLENEQVDAAGSWYVGDETRDVIAARAVGLHVASVTWGFSVRTALEAKKPDAVVDTAQALQKVLKDSWKK